MTDAELVAWSKQQLTPIRTRVRDMVDLDRKITIYKDQITSPKSITYTDIKIHSDRDVMADRVIKLTTMEENLCTMLMIHCTADYDAISRVFALPDTQEALTLFGLYYVGLTISQTAEILNKKSRMVNYAHSSGLLHYARMYCPGISEE